MRADVATSGDDPRLRPVRSFLDPGVYAKATWQDRVAFDLCLKFQDMTRLLSQIPLAGLRDGLKENVFRHRRVLLSKRRARGLRPAAFFGAAS
jgi:hypothetical protein